MDHSLAVAKRLWKLNEAMSHAMQGHPEWTDYSRESSQHMVHWRSDWQTTPDFLLQEPHEHYEKEKWYNIFWGDRDDTPPSSEAVQYATGEEWRTITNSSRKNEEAGPKQKWHSVVDVSGGES